jgi:hypothetical protein
METPEPGIDALVQAAVRRELNKIARRYVPIVGGAIAFALIVALVPTVDERSATNDRGLRASAGSQSANRGSAASDSAAAGAARAAGDTTAPAAPGAAAADTAAAGGGASNASSPAPETAAGVSAPPAREAAGTTRGGVACGKGVRQVSWTAYSPPCQPSASGANGGATTHGVTRDTITITYRRGQSTEDTAVYAAAGDAAPDPDDLYLADMRDYINLFNKTYELYGRKVVLKDFQGQGDYIREDQGQGQDAAAADAATAHDLGAFGDITFALKGSQPFWTGLAQNKVVAVGPLGFPQSYYEKNAPYWYSDRPTGTKGAQLLANVVCRRSAGMPAVFAGDPLYQKKTRTFGLVTPENPEYIGVANEIAARLKKCGVTLTRRASYAINVATFQAQATNIIAQMKAAGVTTFLCFCDPIVPIFLSQSADQQSYRPEWSEPWYRDPQGRLESQAQWAHAIASNGRLKPQAQTEAYRVFKLANPGAAKPRNKYYEVEYGSLLLLFNGLQAAGPNLTPRTFEQGLASLPTSLLGDFGRWSYGPRTYSPAAESQLGWWDPNANSAYDGKKGSWQDCDGGAWYPFDKPEAWGPNHTQLHCFGSRS